MPFGEPAQHVHDVALVILKNVQVDLHVEPFGNVTTTGVHCNWWSPCPTCWTRLNDAWNHVQDFLRCTNSLKKSAHSSLRGMPPTNMQFPESEANGSFSVRPEELVGFANVEVVPIVCWSNSPVISSFSFLVLSKGTFFRWVAWCDRFNVMVLITP